MKKTNLRIHVIIFIGNSTTEEEDPGQKCAELRREKPERRRQTP